MATPSAHPVPALAPSGFFAFRTPLLPFSVLTRWSEGLKAPTASEGELEAALAHDQALLEERLRAIVEDPVVREALFVASPSLDDAIEAWLLDPRSSRAEGVVEIVTRYLARMCSRCTPFGLFSGCSAAELGSDTRVSLAPRETYVRHTRLDTQYLASLCEGLEKTAELRPRLRYSPSTGLFRSAGQFRNSQARIDPSSRARSYTLVNVRSTPYLEATLDRAARGATVGELAEGLTLDDEGVSPEDAHSYIEQLVDAQILTSELAPPVTGLEPIHDIVGTLRAACADAAADRLQSVAGEIDAMDSAGLGLSQESYKTIARALSDLPAKNDLPRLFQVDLYKPAPGATFGGAPLRELERVLGVLARFRRDAPRGERLRRFREAFVERYEGREMPLAEVLDEERGIGVDGQGRGGEPSPLLKQLRFPSRTSSRSAFGATDQWFLTRIAAMVREGKREWELDAKDLEFLGGDSPATPPDALSAMVVLAAPSKEALAAGEFKLWFHGASGPSGATLLGRFCHGDEGLAERVKQHLRAEEALRPDAVFAEVVHLPEGRMGNILCRPVLRSYEIPFLGKSGAPAEQQIQISDLRVSVQGDRVVLRSERLGREVIPRLTTAHNYSRPGLGTYRFLCMLQGQDADSGFGWSWGSVEAIAPFLPRVTLGRTVLSLAKWTLAKAELEALGRGDLKARFRAVQELRRRLDLPRWVGVADGDNVLTVDLDNVVQVESFVALVKKRSFASVRETFPKPEELCASGPEGLFTHEIVVPFIRTELHAATRFAPRVALRRSFATGSEWLYAKLYTGAATADRVLDEVVRPLVSESLANGDADSWFFIRYGDPHWHVRVRFHGDPARLASSVIPRLHRLAAPLLGDGRIWRLTFDTYEREVERYGGDEGMLLCEDLFRADSDAVLRVQRLLSGDAAAEARWRLTLRGMHWMLLDLGLDLPARHALLSSVRASFAKEHRVTGHFERELGTKFRRHRAELETFVFSPLSALGESLLYPGACALDERSASGARSAERLATLAAEGGLTLPLSSIAGSLLHMHANRLLRSEQRAHELVLYDFLMRLYESQIARERKRGRPEAA